MAWTWPWEDTSCDYTIVGDSVVVENDICYMIATPHTLTKSGWVRLDVLTKKYNGGLQIIGGFQGFDAAEFTKFEVLINQEWVPFSILAQKERFSYVDMADWQKVEVGNVVKNKWYTARAYLEVPFNTSGKYSIGIMPAGMTVAEAQTSENLYIIDPWYSSLWSYRKEFTINNAGALLTDYQIAMDINYGAGVDAGTSVYLSGHCQTDFEDIRFTQSDGTTLISEWREEYSASGDATFWVEFNSIPNGNSTWYIYYGNGSAAYPYLASDMAHGQATFISFDDFERGVNGDPIGGTWTISAGDVDISTEQDLGDVANYYGTRSTKCIQAGVNPYADTPVTHSDNIAITVWVYKEDASSAPGNHGDGTQKLSVFANTSEDFYYYDGGYHDTGFNCTPDTWEKWEFRDFVWAAHTYDWYYWPAGVETKIGNNLTMVATATDNDVYEIGVNGGGVGDDTYFDIFYVRNYRESGGVTISAWAAEEELPAYCTSYKFTGIWRGSVILNGNADYTSGTQPYVVERGFDYGTDSTSYDYSETELGTWTPSQFSLYIDGLQPDTQYWYRAKFRDSGNVWAYGDNLTFSTDTANILYQYHNTGDDSNGNDIYSGHWEYQTFTTDNTTILGSSHTVSSVKIYAQRTGNPGDLTVSIRKATDDEPKTIIEDDLCIGTIDADTFETTPTWQEVEMIPEVTLEVDQEYAILVRALDGDNANDVQWRLDTDNGYWAGVAGTSTDGGHIWTPATGHDHLFEIWGHEALEINSAKVYQDYLEEGDWLITCLYFNQFAPYEEQNYDPEEYFYLQLWSDNITWAQTRCPEWGMKPGQIYLSASQVTPLNWGDNYRVRLYGDFTGNPYREYELQPADWVGVDLTRLDMWVMKQTSNMEDYYDVELTTYITNKGRVLNDEGAIIWQTGCPMLMQQRGHLFATTISELTPADDTWTNSMQTVLDWPTAMGTYLTGAFTELGAGFNLSGRIMSAIFAFIIFVLIATLAFGTGHAIAGMACGIPIILAAVFGGSILMVVLGVAVAFGVLLFVWQFIWKGA